MTGVFRDSKSGRMLCSPIKKRETLIACELETLRGKKSLHQMKGFGEKSPRCSEYDIAL